MTTAYFYCNIQAKIEPFTVKLPPTCTTNMPNELLETGADIAANEGSHHDVTALSDKVKLASLNDEAKHARPLHVRTPLIESAALTRALDLPGCRVWLKLDNCQPTGSFKIRGIGRMVERAALESGCQWVVTSSGGNAGLAAAYAASRMRLSCTVVVPRSTPEPMRRRIADEGAEVLVHGEVWREAHAKAEELKASATDRAAVLVHPYDHPDVWAGNSTLVDEIYEDGLVPDAIVLAVGGGGLLCGVAEGLRRRAACHVPIFAAETVGADCLAAALAAGEPVTLERIKSMATSLGASRICQAAWDLTAGAAGAVRLHSVVCTDAEAAKASLRFLEEHLMLTELACGAALSVVYDRRIGLDKLPKLDSGDAGERNIVVVVCGGRNVSVGQLVDVAAAV